MAPKNKEAIATEARRKARQAAALRENLKRRKAQARGRKDGEPEAGGEPEGPERG